MAGKFILKCIYHVISNYVLGIVLLCPLDICFPQKGIVRSMYHYLHFTDMEVESHRICVTYSRSHIWSVSGLTPYYVSVHDPIPAFRNEQIKEISKSKCAISGAWIGIICLMVNTFAMLMAAACANEQDFPP